MKKSFRLFSCLGFLSLTLTGCGSGGGSIEQPVEPPTHEHIWADPTYTWSDDYSSCTAERVCTQDSTHKETETVNSTYIVVTESSCEADGLGRYTVSFENSAFLAQAHDTAIEASGHNWGTPTYTWTDDYSSCTAERVCLNDSSHKETETVNSAYVVVTEPTEESEGLGRYTATFTKTSFVVQIHDVTLDKLEPSYRYGETPVLSKDGKTITYGLYPQKNVDDPTLVSALNALTTPESNGWYLYNNAYYAKVSANPLSSSCIFDNGTTIVSGTTYWFKCEPITWNVLSDKNGEYLILSSVLLDAHRYNSLWFDTDSNGRYANNYEYSEIRSWLNNDFYNSAFALGNTHIQTTTVDNSASTTSSSSNPYACDNTQDKVFLLSYKDYIKPSYGFSTYAGSSDTRYCRTTDWARARLAYCSTSSSFLYNGEYWTRSPCRGSHEVHYVKYDGGFKVDSIYYSSRCVRPALTIKIA